MFNHLNHENNSLIVSLLHGLFLISSHQEQEMTSLICDNLQTADQTQQICQSVSSNAMHKIADMELF